MFLSGPVDCEWGAVKYTDSISAEKENPNPNDCPG